MITLVVHNSDAVKDVFIGETKEEILAKVKVSKYWENIVERLKEELDEDEFNEDEIDFDTMSSLYHDGDSEDGYTEIIPK